MDLFPIKNEYTDCMDTVRKNVESRLPNKELSMFVRDNYELPGLLLCCVLEFNNVTRVSQDDYGLHLMVVYQNQNPRTGTLGKPGEVFALAGLYRSSGEVVSEFAPEILNASSKDFDKAMKSLTLRIKLFLKNQEETIVATLLREYLPAQ